MQSVKNKIISFPSLPPVGTTKSLVLCHGTFDALHYGHLVHLREAKAQGKILVVSVTADAYVGKGPGRPVFDQQKRMEMLAELECVDFVTLAEERGPQGVIKGLHPEVYCKGPDYANPDNPNMADHMADKALVESYGGRVHITSGFTASSTALVNGHEELQPYFERTPELKDYLARVKKRFTPADIDAYFERIKGTEIACIGEAIEDRYVYVHPAGKSAKETLITYTFEGEEQSFEGGVRIAEAHLMAVGARPIRLGGGKYNIRKTRYIERPFMNKIFAMADNLEVDAQPVIPQDMGLTLVTDYGHGLLSRTNAEIISQRAKFLALTCQSNSLNWGFNLLTKWPKAQYIVVDEIELRLVYGDRLAPIETLLAKAEADFGCKYIVVTLGHKGCIIYDGHKMESAPALATKVEDRMGAGDAFLAVTTPFAYLGAPMEMIAFIGNVAAGIEVGKTGNQPVTKQEIRQWTKGLLS